MSSYHLINVWTDAEAGTGGFVPMTDSLLWLPDDFRLGHAAPAIIYLHGWGGYPYEPQALELCPRMAEQGFACLSLCLRRRGMEGQLSAMPDDDLRDIKLGVDFLHTLGCRKVFLAGRELGGFSALRYVACHHDRRVKGLTWLEPVDEPAAWLRAAVGDDNYQTALAEAGLAARQGAAMDLRIDLLPAAGPAVTQHAHAFLAWWSPTAKLSLRRNLDDLQTPMTVFAPDADAVPALLSENAHALSSGEYPLRLADWARRHGAVHRPVVAPQALRLQRPGGDYFGLLWPAAGAGSKTAVLLVHGLTSSPLSPLFQQMAPVLAAAGVTAMAGEMQRSGWAGHESSVLDNDLDDIDGWVNLLLERGYKNIVLAGASIGSISVGRYQSLRQHPNVVAVAHLMPTAECPDWFRQAAGDGPYRIASQQARQAVAEGRGDTAMVDVDIRQPPPNPYGGRFRWTQRAAAWLSWFGPDADSRNLVHIANARVPLLLLSGTDDSYNDAARFAELRQAAVQAPAVEEIWYPNVDHGLAGVEQQVAEDLHAWLIRIGVAGT